MQKWIPPSCLKQLSLDGTCMNGGVTGYNFLLKFLSLKIVIALANSVGPDEMLHNAAFHLGLHCLPKYVLGVTSI